MNQFESITDPDFVHAIQEQYVAVVDEFISRTVYATEYEDGCIIFEVVVAVDTPQESEDLSIHYSHWLTWDYLTQVPEDICGLRRCGILEVAYDGHNEPHVMMVTFKFMNEPGVVIEGIVSRSIDVHFEYNGHNFRHIQYFLDQLRRIIIEHDQEKYTFDETDFPPAVTG